MPNPYVILGRYKPETSPGILSWHYYALYPDSTQPEVCSLPILVRSAFKQGYEIEILRKPQQTMISRYGVGGQEQTELITIQPLTTKEIDLVIHEANRVPPEPKPLRQN